MAGEAPRLVIFDCDGVLVDSEPIAVQVLIDHFADRGVIVTQSHVYANFLGRSLKSLSETARLLYGLDIGDAHLDAIRTDLFSRYRSQLKPMPGIHDVLRGLALPFCVASSSQPERIRLSLEITGLIDVFEPAIFSASMVAHGKPAPDLFLHAARQMGVDPSACVVIEDSPAGIEAASRAGMTVFAFAGGSHVAAGGLRDAFSRLSPDAVFDDMRELPSLIEHLAGR